MIQLTPGAAAVTFRPKMTEVPEPGGSAQGQYLIVSDIEAARQNLLAGAARVSETCHGADGVTTGTDEPYLFGRARVSGPDPERRSYRSFRLLQRSGRQWLAASGGHRAACRSGGGRHELPFGG